MNKKTMIIASALLVLSAGVPVAAYHIQGNSVAGALGSGDWVLDNGLLIICESDGPNDPRNDNALTPLPGVGGLCTTGRNAVTGEPAPATAPGPNNWTQLDVCSLTTAARALAPCAIDTIAFTAEVGIYSCFVWTVGTPLDVLLGQISANDQSLYYEELYAWWSYDGNLTQTGAGYHGHVSVFPETLERAVVQPPSSQIPPVPNTNVQPVTGSVYTDAVATYGANASSCGGSPVGNGPVVVADS